MRIALTHAFCWPEIRRGGERYLHELGASLARRGHHVTIIGGATRSSTSRHEGCEVIRVGRGHADEQAPARFAKAIRFLLTHRTFDVVHSLGPLDAVTSMQTKRLRRKRRTVYTNLGNPKKEWWDTLPERATHERIVAEIDVYGCLSKHALDLLRTDYGREGALTPGGVRLDSFVPGPRANRPTLLYSGALDEVRKGVDVLLDALPLIAEREPDVQLWLSGSGDPSASLAATTDEARTRTTVLDLGRPDDQAERYAGAWTTVLPSIDEAFGLVLVESLACGTPIVGCDHAAIPELVRTKTGPDVGALAEPKDPRSLADACCAALEIARRPQASEACRAAAAPFDWDSAVTPAIEAIYTG